MPEKHPVTSVLFDGRRRGGSADGDVNGPCSTWQVSRKMLCLRSLVRLTTNDLNRTPTTTHGTRTIGAF